MKAASKREQSQATLELCRARADKGRITYSFQAARRLRNRSLLGVNEDFSDKADAERALLYSFLLISFAGCTIMTIYHTTMSKTLSLKEMQHRQIILVGVNSQIGTSL